MGEYGGLIFIFNEPARAEMLEERAGENSEFTDAISSADWKPKEMEIGAISFDGENIKFLSLVKRGKKVASYKYRVEFSNFVQFPAVSFKDIEKAIGPKFWHHFIFSTRGIGDRVPPATWAEFIRILKQLRPKSADDIERLIRLRPLSGISLDKRGFETVAFERDAVGLALDIFGQDRQRVLKAWVPPDRPAPFLEGLRAAKVGEDIMVQHDAHVLGDWKVLRKYVIGAVEFLRNNEKLTVYNANRTDVEHTLGVDLLYYHHKYNSYVLVQYKRMNIETSKQQTYEFVYRPTDKAYLSEIGRMRNFLRSNKDDLGVVRLRDYRLNPSSFYFKLCPKVTLQPLSTDLIKGMYFPIDYWEVINSAPECKGKDGGIRITYNNVVRHINNTLFVQLIQDGWIGSRQIVSSTFTDIIKKAIEGDKSLIFAYSEKLAK
jgi:hypothetical protein